MDFFPFPFTHASIDLLYNPMDSHNHLVQSKYLKHFNRFGESIELTIRWCYS